MTHLDRAREALAAAQARKEEELAHVVAGHARGRMTILDVLDELELARLAFLNDEEPAAGHDLAVAVWRAVRSERRALGLIEATKLSQWGQHVIPNMFDALNNDAPREAN